MTKLFLTTIFCLVGSMAFAAPNPGPFVAGGPQSDPCEFMKERVPAVRCSNVSGHPGGNTDVLIEWVYQPVKVNGCHWTLNAKIRSFSLAINISESAEIMTLKPLQYRDTQSFGNKFILKIDTAKDLGGYKYKGHLVLLTRPFDLTCTFGKN